MCVREKWSEQTHQTVCSAVAQELDLFQRSHFKQAWLCKLVCMLGGWEKKWIPTLKYFVAVTAGHYLTICQLFTICNYEGRNTQAEWIIKTNTQTHRLLLLASLCSAVRSSIYCMLAAAFRKRLFRIRYSCCYWRNLKQALLCHVHGFQNGLVTACF